MAKLPTTLDQLRAELRRAFAETSARAVARELGVAPSGLLKFVETPHATIYAETLKKLMPWYRCRVAEGLSVPAAADVGPAVTVLASEIAPGRCSTSDGRSLRFSLRFSRTGTAGAGRRRGAGDVRRAPPR